MAFTFFFRDQQTLELAIENALPHWLGRAFIRIWDAGCAHGPEPYTLAILLRERMSERTFNNVRIHATDIDVGFADQVSTGVFPEHELRRVPADLLQKYFRPADDPGFVQVVPELRSRVTFAHCDLLSLQPVHSALSMIVCKNVLLHLNEGQRIDVLRMFHQSLQPGGILAMEHTQKMPASLASAFQPIAPYAQVFRKTEVECVAQPAGEGLADGRVRRVDASGADVLGASATRAGARIREDSYSPTTDR